MTEQGRAPINILVAQEAAECDHAVRIKLTPDGPELWHYGDLVLRDGPIRPKAGQTDTGAAIVMLRAYHKRDEEEAKARAKDR